MSDLRIDDYLDLEPLRTRMETHRRFSEKPDDVEGALLGCIEIRGDDDLVDVGSGTGEFVRRLAGGGHSGRLVALDSSPAAVAAAAGPGVESVLGDAGDLPFESATFDVVTARHMLYHVRDLRVALQESHRVLVPGGVFAAVVNNSDSSAKLKSAVTDAARSCGVEVPPDIGARASSANVPDAVASVFGRVEVTRFDNALVFDDAEPLLRHFASVLSFFGVDEPEDRRAVMERLAGTARDWFDSGRGPWRDQKGYTVCAARKPEHAA